MNRQDKLTLIGIAGPARSGKDTAANFLATDYGMVVTRFAAPLKIGLRAMFGLSNEQIEGAGKDQPIDWLSVTPRRLMQTLGTEWGHSIRRDIWILATERRVNELRKGRIGGVVIPDLRFDNEAEWVRSQGGIVIHLSRRSAPAVEAHSSEAGVVIEDGDFLIDNDDSVDELRQRLRSIVEMRATGWSR